MDLREISWDGVEWIHLAQKGPVAGFFEYDDDPSGSGATELLS
jgi:hypothetical protein